MYKLAEGVNQICTTLKPVTVSVLLLVLILTGISTIIANNEAHAWIKEKLKMILFGTFLAFCATDIVKEITSWFL